MRLIRNARSPMRQFVLGELREQARLDIEERLVTDHEAFEALGVAEDELAEEYVEGALNDDDRRRFERHYLVDGERRRYLDLIRSLKSYASAVPRVRPAETGGWARIADLIRANPSWAAAAAAGLVLLVGGNLWLVTWSYRLHGQFEQVRAQQARQEQLRQELQGEVDRLTAQANGLQARLDLPQAGSGQPPTFTLVAGLLRGSGTLTRISVPAGAQVVRLELELTGDGDPPFRAVLDADGEEIWSQAKLSAASAGGRAVVIVLVPAQVLIPGDYQIRLSRTSATGAEVIATYAFRVNPA